MRARHGFTRSRLLAPVIALAAGALLLGGTLTASAADRTAEFEVTGKSGYWGQYQVAYSARNNVLWVSSSEGMPPIQKSGLVKVDPSSLSVLAKYDAPMITDGTPRREAVYGIAVDDEHNTVWATTTRENGVAVYSQQTGERLFADNGSIDHSRDVVVDEGADRAYVGANFGGQIAVYDTKTYQRVGSISIGADSRPMSLELVGSGADAMLYSTDLLTGAIYAINTSAGTVRTIPTDGSGTSGIAVDPKRDRAYIANQYDPTGVEVIDLKTGAKLATVSTPAAVLNADYDAVNDLVYVAEFGSDKVVVIDATTMKQVGNLTVGDQPNGITSANGTAYVVDKSMGGSEWADQIWKIKATVGSTPDPSTDPTTPTPDPTTPSTDPTTPTPDPTTPSTDPTSPSPDPTTPSTDPTSPSTDPTMPTPDPTTPTDPGSQTGSVDVSVSLPATGGLALNVGGSKADLGSAKLSSDLSTYRASGALPEVKVTDLRAANPGWSLTGQVTDLTNGSYTINGTQLGWSPKVTATAEGQTVKAGSRVRPGTGLAAPKVLASAQAGQGTGTATLAADLSLSVPSWARGGTYTGMITITVA